MGLYIGGVSVVRVASGLKTYESYEMKLVRSN